MKYNDLLKNILKEETTNLVKIPIFYTDRLILRDIKIEDAVSFEENFACYDVMSGLSSLSGWTWPYKKGAVLEYIKNKIIPYQGKNQWTWGIFLKDNPQELVGSINLCVEGNPGNRSFWLGKKYWGKGIMTEAVEPVVTYAFTHLKFEKLILANAKGNNRSSRIKENTPARLIYVEPAQYINPNYTEREVWELTKKDWFSIAK